MRAFRKSLDAFGAEERPAVAAFMLALAVPALLLAEQWGRAALGF